MRAGELRHRITFVREEIAGRDAAGGLIKGDKIHARTWSKIEQLNGTELIHAQQKKPNSTHRITTRYVANVTPEMRILFGERTFNIEDVDNPGERNIEIVILCREGS